MKFQKILWMTVLFAILTAAGCTSMKNGLYNMAVNHECRKADLASKHIAVNEMKIAFLESTPASECPTLIMVHGFAANKENWIRLAGHLTDSFHVIAVDLPGHGESTKDPALSYDIDDQVGYLKTILRHLDLERFHMVGNSMGGAIISLYAASYPEQVKSLFLIDPAGIYDYESELFAHLIEGENPLIVEERKDFYELMDFAMEKEPFIPWPIKSVMAERAVANNAINKKIFSEIRGDHDYDFKAELQKIKAPAMILWGREDRVIHWKNASVFNRLIPASETTILDGIGHAPMVEAPEETAEIFKAFVAKQ